VLAQLPPSRSKRRVSPRPGETTNDNPLLSEKTMWSKPEFTEMRFGFEVTMYIYNR
jgi:pyrroloquinoline quinone biosynthesis protein A